MRGRYFRKTANNRAVAVALNCHESSMISIDTLGRSRKRRTGSGGAFRKQSTLFHPRAASCAESSRAKISPAPMRYGSKPNTDATVLFFKAHTADRVSCGSFQRLATGRADGGKAPRFLLGGGAAPLH